MNMSTQKALYIPEKHAPFKMGDAPLYEPGPREVLVKIVAAALNPVDWKIKEYGFFVSEYPWVGGTDGAGIVEQVGSEVTNVAKGDKMYVPGVSRTVSSWLVWLVLWVSLRLFLFLRLILRL